eukprot:COSAG06_NODE_12932_length_1310_cov_634.968621_2_plen_205_part_00
MCVVSKERDTASQERERTRSPRRLFVLFSASASASSGSSPGSLCSMGLWTTTRPFFLALLWRPGPWSDTLSPGAPVSSPQQPAQRAALRQLVRATAATVRVCGAHRLAGWSCPSIALLPRAGARLLHTRRGGEAAAAAATWRRAEVCCFGRGGGDYVWLVALRLAASGGRVTSKHRGSSDLKKQVFAKTQTPDAFRRLFCTPKR